MEIYITGDLHGDLRRFQPEIFYEQEGLTKEDMALVCGDFGCVWHGDGRDDEGLVWLDKPAGRRLERLYPQADNGAEPIPVLAGTVCGTAALMCSMLVRNAADGEEHSPVLHLDLSVPEIEGFDG